MLPAPVTDGVSAFQDAVTAARPLKQAPPLQIAALIAQGHALLARIDEALDDAAPPLDAELTRSHPIALVQAVNALAVAAEDQRTLSDLRGYLGRAVFSLAQGNGI